MKLRVAMPSKACENVCLWEASPFCTLDKLMRNLRVLELQLTYPCNIVGSCSSTKQSHDSSRRRNASQAYTVNEIRFDTRILLTVNTHVAYYVNTFSRTLYRVNNVKKHVDTLNSIYIAI